MDAHERLTGIAHNRVMVFPQGVFSKASLRALDAEGVLAAVNSTIYPVDADEGDIRFRDLLEVAFLRFGGVPLFMRHYPDRLEKFALDVFLGRQVLIVEHHSFFKHGQDALERVAAFVNRIAPDMTWTDLDEICTSACLVRDVPGDGVHVQAFGPVLCLRNRHGRRERFTVFNRWAPALLESVTCDGRVVDFESRADGSVCTIELGPREEARLRFQCAPNRDAVDDAAPAALDRLKVFARRHLCEFRDNYLVRNAFLEQLARTGKGLLPRL